MSSPAPTIQAPREGIRWRPIVRITWLQHRGALVASVALVVGFILFMVIAGWQAHPALSIYMAGHCASGAHRSAVCDSAAVVPVLSTSVFETPLVIVLRAVPLVFGVFLGAPFLARELESGTFRFAWTQGLGRARWFRGTFALLVVSTVLGTVLLGLLADWFAAPFDTIGLASRWQAGQFDVSALTLPGWTLFALCLGALVGTVVRRVVTAMAMTTAILAGLLAFTWWRLDSLVRSIDLSATGVSNFAYYLGVGPINNYSSAADGISGPPGSWLVSGWISGRSGRLGQTATDRLMDDYFAVKRGGPGGQNPWKDFGHWLASRHDTFFVSYQPAGHFWLIQGIEALVLVLLAAALALATSRIVRSRRA